MGRYYQADVKGSAHANLNMAVTTSVAVGFGLGLAESMYLGKPVIGTGCSGNLEFMDNENSCLVDFDLVPVRTGKYLYDDARFQ